MNSIFLFRGWQGCTSKRDEMANGSIEFAQLCPSRGRLIRSHPAGPVLGSSTAKQCRPFLRTLILVRKKVEW